ncbi:MAG TPA: GNAT family N-acetyltransferase [Longimicrobiales bacterium]|nr:GNAT family N-acetyltransferase [Longimicrobiales bacterium]
MNATLQVRAGASADTDRILELVRLSLGEGVIPRAREYWEWKHHANPFGRSPVLLAEADGELVGLRVFMRWEWSAGSQRLRAVRAVDTATHPAWQGQGIFSRLTRALVQQMTEEGVHFIFNTPNEKSRPGYLKMGWRALGRTDLWIRPLHPLHLLRTLAGRAGARSSANGTSGTPAHASTDAQTRLPASVRPGNGAVAAFCQLGELDEFLACASAAATSQRLATPRTAEYLRWRYAAIPGFRYHAHWELRHGDGAAIIMRYKQNGSLREARICELLTTGTSVSDAAARRLLRALPALQPVDYIAAMAPAGTGARRLLATSGFLPAPRIGPVLTVRPLNEAPAMRHLMSRDAWQLSIGDLELF